MRKSRVVLIGVAVAAAAATGSAFTAGNSFGASENIAGYGKSTVTGATVTNIHYTIDPTDRSKVNAVEFTSSDDLTGAAASVILEDNTSATLDSDACTVASPKITCTLTTSVSVEDLASTALTVVK